MSSHLAPPVWQDGWDKQDHNGSHMHTLPANRSKYVWGIKKREVSLLWTSQSLLEPTHTTTHALPQTQTKGRLPAAAAAYAGPPKLHAFHIAPADCPSPACTEPCCCSATVLPNVHTRWWVSQSPTPRLQHSSCTKACSGSSLVWASLGHAMRPRECLGRGEQGLCPRQA